MKKAADFIMKSWRPLVLVYFIVSAVVFAVVTVFFFITWRETEKEKELWPDFEYDYLEESGFQKVEMLILSLFVSLGCAMLWPAIPLLIAGLFFVSEIAQHFPKLLGNLSDEPQDPGGD